MTHEEQVKDPYRKMILVTGASGRVGSATVKSLQQQGKPVRAGIHLQPFALDGVERCILDFDQPGTLPPALEGIDQLFLISREVKHEMAMVEAALEAGIRRIVKLSSFRADKDTFLVGRLHREIERRIEESGVAWTFLRPNYLMQNFITLLGNDIRNEDAIYFSIGDARTSFIDARDVGAVATKVLTERGHEGKAYDLSGPEAINYYEAAAMLSDALGRTIRYVPIGDDEFRKKLQNMGVPDEYVEIFVDVNRQTRLGNTGDHIVTASMEEVTGQQPTSFERFCRDYASDLSPGKDGMKK